MLRLWNNMAKPWDEVRSSKRSITPGSWCTDNGVRIGVWGLKRGNRASFDTQIMLSVDGDWLSGNCLRQLAEFCAGLADDLDENSVESTKSLGVEAAGQ